MLQVARDQGGPVREGDAGDEQVSAADLLQLLVLAQLVEEGGIDRIRIGRHQFAVTQRKLVRGRELIAGGVVPDALVQQLFGQSLSLRRSRPDIPSISAGRHA